MMYGDLLKYRVWDTEEKKYVSEYVFVNHHGEVCLIKTGCFYHHETVVEHCTGWYDKNRRLIYDGDVVLHVDHGRMFVTWSNTKMQFYLSDGTILRHPLVWDMPPTLEIVGNMHDEPKLYSEAYYRRVKEQYCDRHCRRICGYYGMMTDWNTGEEYRCPLLEKKVRELEAAKK